MVISMFCHGIDLKYLLVQYPILSPRLTIMRQNKIQHLDRKHLIEQFGFEPVHFLETSSSFTLNQCIQSCLEFGEVIFVFQQLPLPMLQLSPHEVGIPTIDTRTADYIFLKDSHLVFKLKRLYPRIPIFYSDKIHIMGKNEAVGVWRKSVPSVKI